MTTARLRHCQQQHEGHSSEESINTSEVVPKMERIYWLLIQLVQTQFRSWMASTFVILESG